MYKYDEKIFMGRLVVKPVNAVGVCIFIFILMTLAPSAFAVEPVRALSTDSRIKVVPFEADNVVPVHASTFTTTQIVFGRSEVIEGIQNGDVDAWTVSVQKGLGHMLFLKPTILGSDTNMTVITNGHTYYFHLMSNKRDTSQSQHATYAIHFSYPNDATHQLTRQLHFNRQRQRTILNAKRNPKDYNWDYSFSGARSIMPLHIFDDGRFTYMQLHRGQDIPAIFAVNNAEGLESVVNYRREGQYLVVQQVAPQFTLRDGKYHVVSIFNNHRIHQLRVRGEG